MTAQDPGTTTGAAAGARHGLVSEPSFLAQPSSLDTPSVDQDAHLVLAQQIGSDERVKNQVFPVHFDVETGVSVVSDLHSLRFFCCLLAKVGF